MSEKTAKILLAAVILARSSSYVLAKIGLTDIDVFNLMGIRFLMAFFITGVNGSQKGAFSIPHPKNASATLFADGCQHSRKQLLHVFSSSFWLCPLSSQVTFL